MALTASDLGAGWTQSSDGLVGGTPNTDSRVFTKSDGTSSCEVHLVAEPSPASALTDYPQFEASASDQVATKSIASTPYDQGFATKAHEDVGTDSAGHAIASLSLVKGSYIVVVTLVSTESPTPANDVGLLVVSFGETQVLKLPAG